MPQHVTQRIPAEAWGRHDAPPNPDETWQESWGFVWHDPLRGAGGVNHVSIQRVRGWADVYNWVAMDGEVVGKYQHLNLPIPSVDFPNWEAGYQKVTTHSDIACRLETSFPDVDVSVDLDYQAFTDPLVFSLDVGGATWGDSHYESVGRASGTVTIDGSPVPVSAMAWQDHSWGPRTMAHLLAHRWILAAFGPDLFMSVLQIITAAGPDPVLMGFVYDAGEIHELERVDGYNARIDDDGNAPLRCDAGIWTKAGHGYNVVGTVRGSSVSSQLDNFWCHDGLATFECGGRLGAGIFETQELRAPAPWDREALGLNLPNASPASYATNGRPAPA
jgi:hypothetical protein